MLLLLQVIQGGVNLLDQAEEQEKLLESSARELEKRMRKEGILKQQLREKEAEKQNMEEKYTTLQEEAAGKTFILREVWKQFQHTKEEVRINDSANKKVFAVGNIFPWHR